MSRVFDSHLCVTEYHSYSRELRYSRDEGQSVTALLLFSSYLRKSDRGASSNSHGICQAFSFPFAERPSRKPGILIFASADN